MYFNNTILSSQAKDLKKTAKVLSMPRPLALEGSSITGLQLTARGRGFMKVSYDNGAPYCGWTSR